MSAIPVAPDRELSEADFDGLYSLKPGIPLREAVKRYGPPSSITNDGTSIMAVWGVLRDGCTPPGYQIFMPFSAIGDRELVDGEVIGQTGLCAELAKWANAD